jgi:cytochrome c553
MRRWAAAILLAATACRQEPKEITFDGALADNKPGLIQHGERLTHVLGCTGCHGAHLEGAQFEPEMKQYGPLYASNLTVEVPEYSDAQLDGIIRHGTHPERKSVWVMPSQIFQHLSDADVRALILYLRSLRPTGIKLPPPQFNALDRKEIASGKFKPAVEVVRETAKQLPADAGPRYALGRYITEVTCTECHGSKLEGAPPGSPAGSPPNLIVAGGYTRAEFERLITQGIPTGNRKLNPMMSGVATTRFAHLTSHERDALYAYLKARADQVQ